MARGSGFVRVGAAPWTSLHAAREWRFRREDWIEFDSTPGIERVFVYLSRERDDGVLGVEFGAGGSPVAVQPPDQGTVNDLANGIGSMNLVLGKERRPAASAAQGQAVYVVNPAGGGVWTLIELIHR